MKVGLELSIDGRPMLWRSIDHGVMSLGRDPGCDLCVPHARVEALQAVLRYDADGLVLVNHAAAGTRIGDQLVIDSLRIAHGDRIEIGPVLAQVSMTAGEEATVAHCRGRTRTLQTHQAAREAEYALVLPEKSPGQRWLLDATGVTIGSDAANDIGVDDPYVSRFHARFSVEKGRCIVCDLGSRNGVFIGDLKTLEAEVAPGARVRIGETTVMVMRCQPGVESEHAMPDRLDVAGRLLGSSEAMRRLREVICRVAGGTAPVLVTGETGTGKEVVSRLIAALSSRSQGPFVALNCGALSRSVVESELFGHERGAFTGAVARRRGAFEAAHGGTIFLDEIGELPLETQPQLLRVLETGEIRRVGATETFCSDARVVAATNRRLKEQVRIGAFREDLFHRLHVLAIEVPPLRARGADVIELAEHFLRGFALQGVTLTLAADAKKRLLEYAWPGNVRELRSVLHRTVLLRRADAITAADLEHLEHLQHLRPPVAADESAREGGDALAHKRCKRTLGQMERDAILAELARHAGNKSLAAQALGISRSTMHRKAEEYGIDIDALR